MKKILNFFVLCLFLMTGVCQASDSKQEDPEMIKMYVDSQDLVISDNALFLIHSGEAVQVKSICVDDLGIYIVARER